MATLRLVASLALITGCVRSDPALYSTLPEPIEVAGPPGGEMDREWQSGSADDSSVAYADVSAPASGSGEMTAAPSDGEIDATLSGYGEWVDVDGYGEVWRPYTTAVGANFTPYETCGSWVWTEWGWTFACEWDWGWLPFHYGRWGWFDDYWAWVPGYEWSPAWVEWRDGGGYVGWRPLAPIVRDHRSVRGGGSEPIVRDHRGPNVRDHRSRVARPRGSERGYAPRARSSDWQWRFAAAENFGKPRIRAHLDRSLAEALRVTRPVRKPLVEARVQPVRADSIMRARLNFLGRGVRGERATPVRVDHRVGGRVDAAPVRGDSRGLVRGERPQRRPAPAIDRAPVYQPAWPSRQPAPASFGASHEQVAPPPQEFTPTTPTPSPSPEPTTVHPLHVPDRYTAQPPGQRPPVVQAPIGQQPPIAQPPIAQPPVGQPSVRWPERHAAPQPTTRAPDRAPDRAAPTYTPPSRPTYTPPSPPTYSPPARSSSPTYSPPTYSPPARASGPTYSAPVRSAPTYSPPPSRAPSGGGFSGARGRR